MRNQILYYAIKYSGDYHKIKNALIKKEYYKKIKCKDKFITIVDKNYPKKLKMLKKPPLIIFYKGDIRLLNKAAIAVVGSRKMSSYGCYYTKEIVRNLSKKYVIVSGLAAGIDAQAHISAIKHGRTIAVLGCGINYIYPKSNKSLFKKIEENNLIISEYPSQIKPKPYFFPFRNRIIAALGNSVIVSQAKIKSGTMLTVNEALELNKDIYVLPHRIDDYAGSGCNYLIQQGANVILIDDLANICDNI